MVFVFVGVDVLVTNNVEIVIFVFVVTGTLWTNLVPYTVVQLTVVEVVKTCALEATINRSTV